MFSDFRAGHQQALDALRSDMLAAMMAENLESLKRVAQDGMWGRASAGRPPFAERSG
jgi:hypothetical protein